MNSGEKLPTDRDDHTRKAICDVSPRMARLAECFKTYSAHKRCKLPKDFWTCTKIVLLFVSVLVVFFSQKESTNSGASPVPFWIAVTPVMFLALFLPSFLRVFESTNQYAMASPWPAFPFSVFTDPLPFWHFVGWGTLLNAVPETFHALTPYDHNQMFMALFSWSLGIGALLGIRGAKRRVRMEMRNATECMLEEPRADRMRELERSE